MAIGVLFEFPGVTEARYDAVCKKLNDGQVLGALSDWPDGGILSHVAGATATGWRVVGVWESQAAFEAFGTRLMPLAREMEFPRVAPAVLPGAQSGRIVANRQWRADRRCRVESQSTSEARDGNSDGNQF